MNTISTLSLRAAALATTLFALCPMSLAAAASDAAATKLATSGSIPVQQVGRYVERGTMRIQVSSKLGRPSTVLSDGTFLYDNWSAGESEARGTLVVRFDRNRVSSLSLVTPAVAVALRDGAIKPVGSDLVATK